MGFGSKSKKPAPPSDEDKVWQTVDFRGEATVPPPHPSLRKKLFRRKKKNKGKQVELPRPFTKNQIMQLFRDRELDLPENINARKQVLDKILARTTDSIMCALIIKVGDYGTNRIDA